MAVEILQFIQPWCEEFGRVMAVTCETSWFGEDPMAESFENKDAKPTTHAKSSQTLGKLEPQGGSCTHSNRTKTVV